MAGVLTPIPEWGPLEYRSKRSEVETEMKQAYDTVQITVQQFNRDLGLYKISIWTNTDNGIVRRDGVVAESTLKDNIFVVHALDREDAKRRGGTTSLANPEEYTTPEELLIGRLKENPKLSLTITIGKDDVAALKAIGRYPAGNAEKEQEWRRQFGKIQNRIRVSTYDSETGKTEPVRDTLMQLGRKGEKERRGTALA